MMGSGETVGAAGRVTGRWSWLLLSLVVLAGLVLRIWFGSWDLNQGRFWDERYSLLNILSVYQTGELKPVNAYYPSPVFNLPPAALLRASEATHQRTGDRRFQVLDQRDRARPVTYRLCRGLQAIYGAAAIVFVFLAGRAAFSTPVGLLSAVIVAFAPWPIHASGYLKPDSLLLMTIALALHASLAAFGRPTIGRYLWAGLTIALAMSSKLTGGMIALSLVAATLLGGWRDRRRWALLVAAGAASAVSFVLLNPYWMHYFRYLQGLKRDYAYRAELHDSSRLAMPGEVFGFVTGEYLHGFLLGALGLIGLALLAVTVVASRLGVDRLERARRGMLVAFPAIYTAVYIAQTPYFKANNFLPLVPFTSISIAWMLVSGWCWVVGRWPVPRRRALGMVLFSLLTLWLASRGYLYVYRSYTPTTFDVALDFLERRLRPPHARLVFRESWRPPDPPCSRVGEKFGRGLAAAVAADRLDELTATELERSDGMIFFEHRLASESSDFYRRQVDRWPGHRVRIFEAESFRHRGPTVVAVLNRPKPVGPIIDLEPRSCGQGCLAMDLPTDPDSGESFNLYLYLTHAILGPAGEAPRAQLGERVMDLVPVAGQRNGNLYLTPRFVLDGSVTEMRLIRESVFGDGPLKAQLFRWTFEAGHVTGP